MEKANLQTQLFTITALLVSPVSRFFSHIFFLFPATEGCLSECKNWQLLAVTSAIIAPAGVTDIIEQRAEQWRSLIKDLATKGDVFPSLFLFRARATCLQLVRRRMSGRIISICHFVVSKYCVFPMLSMTIDKRWRKRRASWWDRSQLEKKKSTPVRLLAGKSDFNCNCTPKITNHRQCSQTLWAGGTNVALYCAV